jgi:nucleotide-binding universal stress UspA family protein
MPQNLAEDSLRRDAREILNTTLKEPSRLHPAVRVIPEAFDGLARDGLLRASASADLVVVGAHHRHGSIGMQLGPVNHAVLHHASCPVAIVPPTP